MRLLVAVTDSGWFSHNASRQQVVKSTFGGWAKMLDEFELSLPSATEQR
jgi:hypothetical protein